MPTNLDRAQAIFQAAAALSDLADREAMLLRECQSDAELRRRVDALLHAKTEAPVLAPATERTGPYAPSPAVSSSLRHAWAPGQVFAGRYKLREKLGEGGMGEVWVAEQTEPVQRRVALKLIKTGADSRQMLARFEQERQALALMDHAHIAKVFDAGVSPEGEPYFIMELIKGVPITRYCDDAKLSLRQRLELFIPVCQAAQHAHQKGVIHRDLKPSNILVGLYDGRPVPKVIDFGVAKSSGPRLTDQSIYTEVGTMVGTLEYMSPEQAELNNLDIDTRSDIYALGVILYELLTGSVPFSRKELQSVAFGEMLRMIREVEPPKPSTKVSSSGTLPSIAASRQTEPRKLTAMLRRELDWIVIKCLEKDRGRRYETANGLAMDVQRYLADEPVVAGPPSAAYRLRKFLRRNWASTSAVAVVLLALMVGVIGATWGLFRAERAFKAEAERAEGERQANETAQTRLAQIQKGNGILLAIFTDIDPDEEEKLDKPLRAILGDRLEQAANQLEGETVGQQLAVARLQLALAESLLGLGNFDKAIGLLTKARATCTQQLGPDDPLTLATMHGLVAAYHRAGETTLAEPLAEKTLELRKAKLGPNHIHTLNSMNSLASIYSRSFKLKQAATLQKETLELQTAVLGPTHADTLTSMGNLAVIHQRAGELDQALPIYLKALELKKQHLGPDHPGTLVTMYGLAVAYHVLGKLDLAVPLYEETFRLRKAKLGPNHPRTLSAMGGLAGGYRAAGRLEQALPLYLESLELTRAKQGPDHPDTLLAKYYLAQAYRAAKKPDQALPLLEQAAFGVEKRQHVDERAGEIIGNLCACHEELGQFAQAECWRRKWLASTRARSGPDSTPYSDALASLGKCLLDQKKFADAEPIVRECLAIRSKKSPELWSTFGTMSMLGGVLLGQRAYAEAEPLLLQGFEGMKQREKSIPAASRNGLNIALERIVELYEALDRKGEADKWRKLQPAI